MDKSEQKAYSGLFMFVSLTVFPDTIHKKLKQI